jgi:1-acyl-sn-glycerol-3-phosphate acyltransferase
MEPVYASVVTFAHALFAAQGLKFTIQGADNIPGTGGAVLASNHLSYFDFAYLGLAAEPAGRRIRFMAKDEVFRNPVSGFLMRGMRHIPVDRAAGAASYRAAVAALKSGEVVGVFPEATTSRSMEPMPFKAGSVRMAAAAGVPVLPTAIWGSQRTWNKSHRRLGRSKVPIHIAIGEPIMFAKPVDYTIATDTVAAAVTKLLHGLQEQYPELTGADLMFLPQRLGGTAPSPEQAAELDAMHSAKRAAKRAARAK